MSLPSIESTVAGYKLTWAQEHIMILISRIREHRDGSTKCEIAVKTDAAGFSPHLHQAQFPLTSTQARSTLAKLLTERYAMANWAEMLEQVCVHVLERLRAGEPLIVLDSSQDVPAPAYLIEPIVFASQPTVIFGAKASAKSYLAATLLICTSSGCWPEPLGLRGPSDPVPSMYLDWESHYTEIAWRHKLLTNGMGLSANKINYRRCTAPLADDIEQIEKLVKTNGIRFLVVDSVGAASGADLNASEPALRFLGAVRKLDLTSLLITHTSKEDTPQKTAYGNIYYTNLPRSIWEIRKVQDINESTLSVGLFQRQSNLSKLHRPLGFRISFLPDATIIEREDIRDIPELAGQLGLKHHLVQLLKVQPLQTVKEMAEELEKPEVNIRVYLNRFKEDFVRLGDKWALKARVEHEA